MNNAGLTIEFKKRFFDHLHALGGPMDVPRYAEILVDLHSFPRIKGDRILAASFVSKMIAIHDEHYPIYDKYVREVFGIAAPGQGSIEYRARVFAENIELLQARYFQILGAKDFGKILGDLCSKNPDLSYTHGVRIIDFLVWQVGKDRLLDKKPDDSTHIILR